MKFPPFFGQVVKPRFWQSHSPEKRETGHGPETEKTFGRVQGASGAGSGQRSSDVERVEFSAQRASNGHRALEAAVGGRGGHGVQSGRGERASDGRRNHRPPVRGDRAAEGGGRLA